MIRNNRKVYNNGINIKKINALSVKGLVGVQLHGK